MINKPKQIPMTVKSGIYDEVENVVCLPDDWNGDRWVGHSTKGSDNYKAIMSMVESFCKFGISTSFLSIVIPNDFEAVCDGTMFKYKKGMRLLLDVNRRRKALGLMRVLDKTWQTPEGDFNKVPINDVTDMVEHHFGKIKDMNTDGKDKIFKYLLMLNHGNEPFSDRSIIIGGAVCIFDIEEREKFKFIKTQLEDYGNHLGDISIFYSTFGDRGSLSPTEKDSSSLIWEGTDVDKSISKINLALSKKIYEAMSGVMKQPMVQVLIKLLSKAIEDGFLLHQEKRELAETNKQGKMTLTKQLITSSIREDCFKLPSKTADDFLDKYETYTKSIADYYIKVWIPELLNNKAKLTSAAGVLTEEIESRVSKMWEYFLNEK